MSFPRPLAVLLTSLMTTGATPEPKPIAYPHSIGGVIVPPGMHGAMIGPHAFVFPENVFKEFYRPTSNGSEISFVLRWPSLEPWPKDVYMYRDQETFVSSLRISVSHVSALSDEAFHRLPMRLIEPIDPDNPDDLAHPARNLRLRIKGEPVHGLTPYYTDFAAVERFHAPYAGPGSHAASPANSFNDDWYIDMGPDGRPRTVLKCSVAAIPDGVTATPNGLVVKPDIFRRATCDHDFFLPEYRAWVSLSYQRIVMADWQRIEARIRQLFHDGEIKQ